MATLYWDSVGVVGVLRRRCGIGDGVLGVLTGGRVGSCPPILSSSNGQKSASERGWSIFDSILLIPVYDDDDDKSRLLALRRFESYLNYHQFSMGTRVPGE